MSSRLATTRKLVTIDDAANYLGVHTMTVRRRISSGDLKAWKVAGSRAIRLDMADVEAMLVPVPTVAQGGDSA